MAENTETIVLDPIRFTSNNKFIDVNDVVWVIASDGSISPEKDSSLVIPVGYMKEDPHLVIGGDEAIQYLGLL